MKKLSRKAREIEARRAADPIAQALGRTDIDYTDPDQLPSAPRITLPAVPVVIEAELAPKEFVKHCATCTCEV
jgi:hypothetical protein